MNARTSTPGSVAIPKNILCSLSALRFSAQERDKSNLNERTVHINRIHKFVVSNASSEDVLDALCAMGLPLILMDIFQCEDYFILENGKLKNDSTTICAILNDLLSFMIDNFPESNLIHGKEVFLRVPILLEWLWTHRTLLILEPSGQPCILSTIYEVIHNVNLLHMLYHQGSSFPLSCHYLHMVFYTWITATPMSDEFYHEMLSFATTELRFKVGSDRQAELRKKTFFREVLTDTAIVERLIKKICTELCEVELVLRILSLDLILLLVKYFPGIACPRLAEVIALACEKVSCSPGWGRMGIHGLRTGLQALGMLIDLIPKHTKDETFLNADPKHVLPFVAHTYASADSLNNVEVISFSSDVLHRYIKLAETPGIDRALTYRFQKCVDEIWFPVLRQIQYYSRSTSHSIRTHETYWRESGKTVGLDTITMEAEGLKEEKATDLSGTEGMENRCRWVGCVCYLKDPVHQLHTCTGCRKAKYCNSKCQSLDWKEGGHRKKCASKTKT